MKLAFGLFAALICIATANANEQERPDRGERTSIIRLIATPDAFHEKTVFVSGYLMIGLEINSLCLSKTPLDSKNCLWVDIDDGPWESIEDNRRVMRREKEWMRYNKKVVSLRATFDKNNTGHFGGWSGGLSRVSQVFGRGCSTTFTSNHSIERTCAGKRGHTDRVKPESARKMR